MNKKKFMDKMSFQHENDISNIYDKIIVAQKTGRNVYTNEFYTPHVWKMIENMEDQIGLSVSSYGIFENAERRILVFSEGCHEEEYPVNLIKIATSSKFSKLCHRDYLGALMSLGLKREKFGDLILQEDGCCYVACSRDISQYIESSFTRVGNLSCKAHIMDLNNAEIPDYNFETEIIVVSSLRIDCIVSSICNLSRSGGEELVKKGRVQLDYFECDKKDRILEYNSTITIRGYGKFKLLEKVGTTGKGRIKVLVKKFI